MSHSPNAPALLDSDRLDAQRRLGTTGIEPRRLLDRFAEAPPTPDATPRS